MAGSWFIPFCLHFEAFAALHVHCELLPGWKYFFQALPAPIACIVMHADDVIEV